MSGIFSRTELLLGAEGLRRLQQSSVAVFGVGGVGGFAAEALVRSGVGAVTIVDSDVVSPSNINRQIIALHSTVGRPKTEVLGRRLLDINPALGLTERQCFYDAETAGSFELSQYSCVIDAIDSVTSKLLLIERAYAAGTPVLSSMGAGNKLDPSQLRVGNIFETSVCPLARVMRTELRKRGIPSLRVVWSPEPPIAPRAECSEPLPPGRRAAPGSVAFVPSVAGLLLAGEAVRMLAGV